MGAKFALAIDDCLKSGVDVAPQAARKETLLSSSSKTTRRRTVYTSRIAELIMRRDIGFAAGECAGNII